MTTKTLFIIGSWCHRPDIRTLCMRITKKMSGCQAWHRLWHRLELLKVTKMPCHYGGFTFFGLCPCCSKQVRDLYFYKTAFACRHCFRMTYFTRHTTLSMRLILKRERIGKRINDDKWNKPKWMRQKTFAKLRSEYFDLDEKELIADFYSLRTNRSVDKLFAKYGCIIAAAEALEMQFLSV